MGWGEVGWSGMGWAGSKRRYAKAGRESAGSREGEKLPGKVNFNGNNITGDIVEMNKTGHKSCIENLRLVRHKILGEIKP